MNNKLHNVELAYLILVLKCYKCLLKCVKCLFESIVNKYLLRKLKVFLKIQNMIVNNL